ncbi:MAG TPA: phosphatase PAP2 family protein [Prolixibacteraceae bacterium]|nr:phosphatase PAP2 family protein [Prolixibacteraceae bacterium]
MKNRFLIVLFLLLSVSSFAQNIDIRLLRAVYSPRHLAADNFMKLASNTNNGIVIGIPLTLGVAGLLKHDEKLVNTAFQLVAANAINLAATVALKYSVNRDRPFETYPDIQNKVYEGTPSFPSFHTSSAFATATTLSLNFPKWYVVVPSYLWAGTVGYSRMHLGVHYPTDVLGGVITGAGSAYLTFKLNQWIDKKYFKEHEYK